MFVFYFVVFLDDFLKGKEDRWRRIKFYELINGNAPSHPNSMYMYLENTSHKPSNKDISTHSSNINLYFLLDENLGCCWV